MTCARGTAAVLAGYEERCWWCFAVLCGDCWEQAGHCGHVEADAVNARIREELRTAQTPGSSP